MEFDLNFFEAWDNLTESSRPATRDLDIFLDKANFDNLPASWKDYVDREKTKKYIPEGCRINTDMKFYWKCNNCGYTWKESIHSMNKAFHNGRRHDCVCPKCGGNAIGNNNSKPELMVYNAVLVKLSDFLNQNNIEAFGGRWDQKKLDLNHYLDISFWTKDTKCPIAAVQYDGDNFHSENSISTNNDIKANDSVKYDGKFLPVLRIKETTNNNLITHQIIDIAPRNTLNNPNVCFYYIDYSSHRGNTNMPNDILNKIVGVIKNFLISRCNLLDTNTVDNNQINDDEYNRIKNTAELQLRGCIYKIWLEYTKTRTNQGKSSQVDETAQVQRFGKFLQNQTPFKGKQNITLYNSSDNIIAKNVTESTANKEVSDWAKNVEKQFVNNTCDEDYLYFKYNTPKNPNFLSEAKIVMEKINLY